MAECDNLEGKDVAIYLYEKKPLLEAKDTKLKVIQNDKEVEKICATVKDGYAVAEIQLQKPDSAKYKEWDKKLDPDTGDEKSSELYLKVVVEGIDSPATNKKFLEENNFILKTPYLIFPLKNKPLNYESTDFENYDFTEDQGDTMATYNANRSGSRKHAARDLYTEALTEVVAMTKGRVLRVAYFYSGTYQVTIEHFYQHKEGYNLVLRYGEMDKDTIKVKVGDIVEQGDILGKTGKLMKSASVPRLSLKNKITNKSQVIYMLHLEAYTGEKGSNIITNRLTTSGNNFQRRSDLFDALDILKPAFKNSFNEDL